MASVSGRVPSKGRVAGNTHICHEAPAGLCTDLACTRRWEPLEGVGQRGDMIGLAFVNGHTSLAAVL